MAALGAEFPCLDSACEAGKSKPVESGWKPASFELARAWQGPLVTQAGWGDIAPIPGGSLLLPSAPTLGVQPIQQHCNSRLAKSTGETAPWLPHCYPVMYSTGMYVQHPSTTPSISRQYCKHSLVNSLSHLLHLSSPETVNKQKILE